MKINSNIVELFLFDWLVTLMMYLIGTLVSFVGLAKYVDLFQYVGLIKVSNARDLVLDTFTYLLTSIMMVILFSFLINLSKVKAAGKEFILAQLLYIFSFVLVLFLLTLF